MISCSIKNKKETANLFQCAQLGGPNLYCHSILYFCSELSFRIKHKINQLILFLNVLCSVSKGSLNIPEDRCLLIGRVLQLYERENPGRREPPLCSLSLPHLL